MTLYFYLELPEKTNTLLQIITHHNNILFQTKASFLTVTLCNIILDNDTLCQTIPNNILLETIADND